MSKYDPLRDYLRAQKHQRVSMSFAEIEKLGVSLPASAIKHRPWWANNKHHSQANAWLDAGYETQQVDIAGRRLTFYRTKQVASPAEEKQNTELDEEHHISDESVPNDKYEGLKWHLMAQSHERVSMRFHEIENVMGSELPKSAKKHRPWWANNKHHTQAAAWLEAGYETETVEVLMRRVSFRRYT